MPERQKLHISSFQSGKELLHQRKLISVSEYAAIHGKDPGNIRRYLASGRMEGQKIGNQWVLPENAEYPTDNRVKNDGRAKTGSVGRAKNESVRRAKTVSAGITQTGPAGRAKTGSVLERKKTESPNAGEDLSHVLDSVTEKLQAIYGPLLRSIVLYGSYARGTPTHDSDVDISIFLDGKPDKIMTAEMIKCVSEHELQCDKVLSVIDIQMDHFSKWKEAVPFYKNIEEEGIVIWKAS